MSKLNFVQFCCDNCGNKIVENSDDGFPYMKKWIYIYNLNFQFVPKSDPDLVTRSETKDKHFCSKKCMFAYIKQRMEEE